MITAAVELPAVAPTRQIKPANSGWIVFLRFMRISFLLR